MSHWLLPAYIDALGRRQAIFIGLDAGREEMTFSQVATIIIKTES